MKELPYITWKQKLLVMMMIKDAHLIYAATNQHAVNMMMVKHTMISSGLTL